MRKTKEERLAEQKALIEKASLSADLTERESRGNRASVFGRNIAKDAQMKLEEANNQIIELQKQIDALKNSNIAPDLIATLEQKIKTLQSKATLDLNPHQVIVTRFANRDEIFFRTAEFYELVESIRENGQAIPITVRPSSLSDSFELISGRRRLEACKILGIDVVAILVEADDKKLTELQVLENFRDDLSHFEEADNFDLMINEGFFKSNTELARTFSISEGKISQLRSISRIPVWLRNEFLIEIIESKRTLPSGDVKDVVELNIAPSRMCYELSKHIGKDFDTKYSNLIKNASAFIKSHSKFQDRIKSMIDILDGNSLPSKPSKPALVKEKIRIGDKVVGETSKVNGSLQIRIPKKYNSESLTEKIEQAVFAAIDAHFSNK